MEIEVINPWSGSSERWTWSQIRRWADAHIAAANREEWLWKAESLFWESDGKELGRMIIGS
jgi:hypothetical protein